MNVSATDSKHSGHAKLAGFTAKKIERGGGCMLHLCHIHLSMRRVLADFMEGRMEGWHDSEKGYDEDECGFVSDVTGAVYCVYSRYGAVRVGGNPEMEHEAKALADALAAHFGLA